MLKTILSFLLFFRLVSAEVMTPALLQLLEVTGVSHDGTLSSIVEETQKHWLRPIGIERWEMTDLDKETREKVFVLADQLGFIQECRPTQKEYDYAILLGATVF